MKGFKHETLSENESLLSKFFDDTQDKVYLLIIFIMLSILTFMCYLLRIKKIKHTIRESDSKFKSVEVPISIPETIFSESSIKLASAPLDCCHLASAPPIIDQIMTRTEETFPYDRDYCNCAGECNNRKCVCIKLNKNCSDKCHLKIKEWNINCKNFHVKKIF